MIPVKITIHSENLSDGSQPLDLVTSGQLQTVGRATYVRYEETPITGMEGTKTTLKWTEDTLTVIRHGRYEHRQTYVRGRNTSFQYQTPYFTVPMMVFTRDLTIVRQPRGWHVQAFYDLEMQDHPNGSIRLTIEIEEEEIRGHEKSTGRSGHRRSPKSHSGR